MNGNNCNQIGSAAKASFWFLICNIIQKGMSAICTPIFTRIMDSSAYGEYTVYLSWYQIISIFATLNLSAGVLNNALTENYDDANRISSSFIGLSTMLSCILIAVYWIFPEFWKELFSLNSFYINLIIVESLFSGAYAIWAAKERYDYKYKRIVATCIISGILGTFFTIVVVILSENKSFALIVSYAFIQIAMGLIFYMILIAKGGMFFSGKYWKFALSFNLPLIPHYLSYILLNQSDRIMIDHLIGKSATALYGVAYSISMIMMLFVTAVNNTLIPYSYKSIKRKSFAQLGKITNFLMTLCFIGCCCAMLIGPEFIRIFASDEYYDAVYIIPPVAASVFLMFCQSLIGTVAFYFKRTKFVMIATTMAAALNIFLNYFFIPQYGYIAAGYTTLFSYFVLMTIHFVFYRYICNEKLNCESVFCEKNIWWSTLGLAIFIPVSGFLYSWTIIRWIVIGVIAVIIVIKRKIILSVFGMIKQ